MEKDELKKISNNWLFQGFIVALIPAFAYLSAFLYEFGYASYFHIPVNLISLSATQFCLALFSTSLLFVGYFFLVNSVFRLMHLFTYKNKNLTDITFYWGVYIVLIIIFSSRFNFPTGTTISLISALLGFLIINQFLIKPILKRVNSSLDKDDDGLSDSLLKNSPVSKIERHLGIRVSKLIFWFIVVIFFSFLFGDYQASRQSSFMILEGDVPTVVLRVYDGNLIMAKYDVQKKEVSRTFFISSLGQNINTEKAFSNKEIGPLSSSEEFK